jgi:hypothetical protein
MNVNSQACILCVSSARDDLAPVGVEFRPGVLVIRVSADLDDNTCIYLVLIGLYD